MGKVNSYTYGTLRFAIVHCWCGLKVDSLILAHMDTSDAKPLMQQQHYIH